MRAADRGRGAAAISAHLAPDAARHFTVSGSTDAGVTNAGKFARAGDRTELIRANSPESNSWGEFALIGGGGGVLP